VTERLYYIDPCLAEFDAQVLQIVEAPNGRPALVLDRTAFYPTSGGQPCDTGTMGAAAISDVIDQDDGTSLHVLSEASVAAGLTPLCRRTAALNRRFDHMRTPSARPVAPSTGPCVRT
jgi:alanyl-tRNA synthetase